MATVRYTIESGRVCYTHHYVGTQPLEGANAATFAPLVDPVVMGTDRQEWQFAGRDQSSVWFMNKRIDEADVASFRYFYGGQCHWGTDRSHVYCFYPGERPRVKVAKSGSAVSLRFLDEPFGAYMRRYALDDRRVYYHGRWVRGADPQTFRNLPEDRFDEPAGRSDLYRDATAAYYFGRELEGIDPDALIVFQHPSLGSRAYAVDRDHTYHVDATTRTPGRDVSGTPLTRLTHEEVRTAPHLQQVRDYLARRRDLIDYWFNRSDG